VAVSRQGINRTAVFLIDRLRKPHNSVDQSAHILQEPWRSDPEPAFRSPAGTCSPAQPFVEQKPDSVCCVKK
jgi:hypothetical protein